LPVRPSRSEQTATLRVLMTPFSLRGRLSRVGIVDATMLEQSLFDVFVDRQHGLDVFEPVEPFAVRDLVEGADRNQVVLGSDHGGISRWMDEVHAASVDTTGTASAAAAMASGSSSCSEAPRMAATSPWKPATLATAIAICFVRLVQELWIDRFFLFEVTLHCGQGLDQAAEAEAEVVAGNVGEKLLRLAVAVVLGLFGLGDFDQRGPQQDGERNGAEPAGDVNPLDAAEVGDVARQFLRHDHGEPSLRESLVFAKLGEPGRLPLLGPLDLPEDGAALAAERIADVLEDVGAAVGSRGPARSDPAGTGPGGSARCPVRGLRRSCGPGRRRPCGSARRS